MIKINCDMPKGTRISIRNSFMEVSGWAISTEKIKYIKFFIDDEFIDHAVYGLPRPDVKNVYPAVEGSDFSGFYGIVNFPEFKEKISTIRIDAVSNQMEIASVIKEIIVENSEKSQVNMSDKANKGFCPICEKNTIFLKHSSWLRDDYKCKICHSIPRQRALINTLNVFFPNYPKLIIHESSPCGASSDFIKKECQGYTSSQYFLDVDTGSYKKGIRCENLEKLNFEDDSFDLFITQDVFEHIINPDKAFKEIQRVLKPGGAHVFTVAMFKNLKKTRPRVVEFNGRLKHLLEAQYHANPIDPAGGALVTYDYGIDLPDYIYEQSGMYTTIFLNRDIKLGLDGEFLEVFISKKYKKQQYVRRNE